MKRYSHLLFFLAITALIVGCAAKGEDETPKLKKTRLERNLAKKQAELDKAAFEAKELEKELLALDPAYKKKQEEKKWRMVSARPVAVKNFEQRVDFQGTVETKGDFRMSSETGGTIIQLNAREGQKVKQGQLLGKVDDQMIQRSMDELETSLRFARNAVIQRQAIMDKDNDAKQNSLDEIDISIQLAEEVVIRRKQIITKDKEAKQSSISELETSINLAQQVVDKQRKIWEESKVALKSNKEELELALKLAQDVFDRREKLWKQNIGSEIEYLQAKNNLESIQKKLESLNSQIEQSNMGKDLELTSAIKNLESLQKKKQTVQAQFATADEGSDLELASAISNVESLKKKRETLVKQINTANQGSDLELDKARTDVESLEKKKATLQTQLEKTSLYAPATGVIDQVLIKQGEMAGPGIPILTLINTSKLQVAADVPESYLAKLKVGDPVVVDIPSLNQEQTAKIGNIGELINPNNRTIKVEVPIANKGGKVKPNLIASVQLREFAEENAIVVPTNYILNDMEGSYVFVVEKKGDKQIAKRVNIKIGTGNTGETTIMEGLKGGEQLITEGSRMVNDGDPVKVVK